VRVISRAEMLATCQLHTTQRLSCSPFFSAERQRQGRCQQGERSPGGPCGWHHVGGQAHAACPHLQAAPWRRPGWRWPPPSPQHRQGWGCNQGACPPRAAAGVRPVCQPPRCWVCWASPDLGGHGQFCSSWCRLGQTTAPTALAAPLPSAQSDCCFSAAVKVVLERPPADQGSMTTHEAVRTPVGAGSCRGGLHPQAPGECVRGPSSQEWPQELGLWTVDCSGA
jgi:hypothetical protein